MAKCQKFAKMKLTQKCYIGGFLASWCSWSAVPSCTKAICTVGRWGSLIQQRLSDSIISARCSAEFSGRKRVSAVYCTLKQGIPVAGKEVLILTLTLDLPCFSVHWRISGSFQCSDNAAICTVGVHYSAVLEHCWRVLWVQCIVVVQRLCRDMHYWAWCVKQKCIEQKCSAQQQCLCSDMHCWGALAFRASSSSCPLSKGPFSAAPHTTSWR